MSDREPSPSITELTPLPSPARRTFSIIPWVVTLAFALVALWLLAVSVGLRSASALLETERDLARVSDRLARSQLEERTLLAEKIISELGARKQGPDDLAHLRVMTLTPDRTRAPDAKLLIVLDPLRKIGLLTGDNLPPLANGEVYQLWVESAAAGNPQSIGTFEPDIPGRLSVPFALTEAPPSLTRIFLTTEKSPAPTIPGSAVLGSAGF